MAPKRPIAKSRSYSIFASLVISVLLLASCGVPEIIHSLSNAPGPTASALPATSTPIPPSPTSQVSLEVPTPVPATTTLPATSTTPIATTSVAQPTASTEPASVEASGEIVFAPGTTAAVEQGTLQPGQVVTYTMEAAQSQPMILLMESPNDDITLGVFEPDGTILLDPANKSSNWQGVLPTTGLYKIQVIGGATAESYSLSIKIAQVVYFASGATSITLNGTTTNGYLISYALNCSASQTMTAILNVPSSIAYLDIFGITSGTLLSDSEHANSWTGVLPQTDDYVIEVIPTNDQVVNYTLAISVTGIAANTTGGDIVIKPGSTAAVMQGTVQPGQVVTYTLQAYQYQPLVVNVDSPNFDVTIGVVAPDGTMMFNPANKWTNWQVPLHETGLYTIQVFGGATTENYILTVKLPKHVYLGNGTNTVTITSATEQGFIVSYAINGNAGETLTVSLNVPSSTAYLDVFGVGTGSLLSYTAKANSWTGTLSETQLYVIEVIPRGGWTVGYSLTITLQ